jgi:hypothetical protein
MIEYRELLDPRGCGVAQLPGFLGSTSLAAIGTELADPTRVAWHNSHATYENKRQLTIVQNYDTFALKLSQGDQRPLQRLPYIRTTIDMIRRHVKDMSVAIPTLRSWTPDEASIQRYDNAEVGLSFHKDNLRFFGLIAILSLDGVCDLAIQRPHMTSYYTAQPGDLMLLRASTLVNTHEDLRPEHAVLNLQTPTRTSLTVRANDRPDEAIPDFHFTNW